MMVDYNLKRGSHRWC